MPQPKSSGDVLLRCTKLCGPTPVSIPIIVQLKELQVRTSAIVYTDSTSVDLLLIDDEPSVLKMLSACLRQDSYTFRCASDGPSALRLLRRQRFKIIVTDVFMPGMDGLEVIMHCMANMPGIPILAISGGAYCLDASTALRIARPLGSAMVLAKPFAPQEFLAVVQKMIAGTLSSGTSVRTESSYSRVCAPNVLE